jgi:hypothetical protein
MKAVVKRRERLVRVRKVQHLQATAVAAQAEARAETLEQNAARLVSLRGSLTAMPGTTFAGALSNAGELSMRLDAARHGMNGALADARVTADRLGTLRLEARIRQESAEKLGGQADAAYAAWRERRASTPHRRKPAARENDA